MRRIIAALFLTTLAGTSFAQDMDQSGRTHVNRPGDCPVGTTANAYYEWQGGRFTQEGWVCEKDPSPI
jgi:hypothetical protein